MNRRALLIASALLATSASCRLLNHEVDCDTDKDCVGFGVCDQGVCRGGGEGEGSLGEGEGAIGEGEGTVGEGEGASTGEGEGEGSVGGPLPTAILDAPTSITATSEPAMCAGKTVHVSVDLTAKTAVSLVFSTTSNALTVTPPQWNAGAGSTQTLDVAWEIGAPPGVSANLDMHDGVSNASYSIPIHFIVDASQSSLVAVPAQAKHDVLYVLDDSASMQTELANGLLASMATHLDAVFASPTPDLRFAVTDIDDGNSASIGPFGDPRLHNGPFVDASDANARADLDATVNDLWGSFAGAGTECPVGAMVDSFSAQNTPMQPFLRSDASLHIIYIGDSPDQTPNLTTAQAESALDQLVLDNKTKAVHVHAIAQAGANEDCSGTPLDVDPRMDAIVADEARNDIGGTICDTGTRNAALHSIANELRLGVDDVLVSGCDASASSVVCARNGDLCEPIAHAVLNDSTCDVLLSPDIADVIAGKTLLVAKGPACTL